MIWKDLQSYGSAHWGKYLTPVTQLSKSGPGNKPLVKSAAQMYSYDDICAGLFPPEKVPTSADGIEITDRSVRFIEFKSGFKKKITKYNFEEEKGRCKAAQTVCKDYWDLFFKKQEKETNELIASIRFKALESYLTMEKQLLPCCQDIPKPISVTFTAVIDGDAVENMVDTLAGLSGKREVSDTSFARVKKALSRLECLQDAEGNTYCYDKIEVLSAQDYENQLRQRP